MLRKTTLLSLLAFNLHAGVYVGAGLGSDFVSYKQSAHIVKPGDFNAFDTTHLAGTGIFGTLFGGLEMFRNQYYLAGELNGNISSNQFHRTNKELRHSNFSDSSYKINNIFGVSILPGFIFTPDTLFYGRLGYANGHLVSESTDPSLSNTKKRLDGFRYGLGARRTVSNHFDIRFDYSLISYRPLSFSTLDRGSNTTKDTKVKPFEQLVELSLIYRFDPLMPLVMTK